MRKISYFLAILFTGFVLSGCATLYQITPKQKFSLQEGRMVFRSDMEHSSVELVLASLDYSNGTPLVMTIHAKLNTPCQESCVFSSNDISLYSEGFKPSIIPPKVLLNSSLNFVSTLQAFSIPIPPFSPSMEGWIGFGPPYSPFYPPFFGGGFFGVGFSGGDNGYYQESEFSRRILYARYLKPSTLDSKNFTGGFVAINMLGLKKSGVLNIEVKVNSDIHHFSLSFSPPSK